MGQLLLRLQGGVPAGVGGSHAIDLPGLGRRGMVRSTRARTLAAVIHSAEPVRHRFKLDDPVHGE
eukprot:scaffold432472_cov27-Prasinocladus_malaysianus.AAC.2